jgi:uncharacterized membrane protein
MEFSGVILGIVIGTLAAIVYSLRVLVLMERRVARIDSHIEALVLQVLKTEERIESEEKKIESMLAGRSASKKVVKPVAAKKKVASKPKPAAKIVSKPAPKQVTKKTAASKPKKAVRKAKK